MTEAREEWDLERTRSILDPIHGLIRLTQTEMRVIDDPLFQRLRHIRQNGLLFHVFPAATHTRFEHSLGVLYVAHGMLNSLSLNSTVGLAKRNVSASEDVKVGEAIEFPAPQSAEWKFLYTVTRLAALVHDLGHGPLSHTFDSFAPRRRDLERILRDPVLGALAPLRELIATWGMKADKGLSHRSNNLTPHEVMSCLFFTKIWNDMQRNPGTARAVVASILGGDAHRLLADPVARRWVPLIHDIIASAPADADRMDYLERDSRAIGVTYGLFDRNRVLKSLLCYQDEVAGEASYRLGIKSSGLMAIENLMQARYELFVQVYYHKTNRAVSRMLERIGSAAEGSVQLFGDNATLNDWIDRYQELSDEFFVRVLRGKTETEVSSEITELMDAIVRRTLWKRVYDPSDATEVDVILKALHDRFPEEKGRIAKDETKPQALKDLDGGAGLLVRNARGVYQNTEASSWSARSQIIDALAKADSQFVRIYYDGSDEKKAKEVRSHALELSYARRNRNGSIGS